MGRLQPFQRSEYVGFFSAVDTAFRNGQVASNQKGRENVGKIGVPLSDLWDWSLGYRMPLTRSEFGASQASHLAYNQAVLV